MKGEDKLLAKGLHSFSFTFIFLLERASCIPKKWKRRIVYDFTIFYLGYIMCGQLLCTMWTNHCSKQMVQEDFSISCRVKVSTKEWCWSSRDKTAQSGLHSGGETWLLPPQDFLWSKTLSAWEWQPRSAVCLRIDQHHQMKQETLNIHHKWKKGWIIFEVCVRFFLLQYCGHVKHCRMLR